MTIDSSTRDTAAERRFVERANGRIVTRASDYDPCAGLRVAASESGDVVVSTVGEATFTPSGGRSTNTRIALLRLFEAMNADHEACAALTP